MIENRTQLLTDIYKSKIGSNRVGNIELKLGVIFTYFVHGLNYPNHKKHIFVLYVTVKKENLLILEVFISMFYTRLNGLPWSLSPQYIILTILILL